MGNASVDSTGPFPDDEVPVLVLRAARAMIDEVRKRKGSSASKLTLVHGFAIRFLDASGPTTTSELAQHLGVTKQSASEIVGALEATGKVCRRPNPDDGRSRTIELTALGRRELAASRQRWRTVEEVWAADVGWDDLAIVRRALQRYLASLETASSDAATEPTTKA